MRGMKWLVDVRRKGFRPLGVAIDLNPHDTELPCVLGVEPSDVHGLTDLRAVVGLRVHVFGDEARQVDAWAQAACAAGAASVVAYIGAAAPKVFRAEEVAA